MPFRNTALSNVSLLNFFCWLFNNIAAIKLSINFLPDGAPNTFLYLSSDPHCNWSHFHLLSLVIILQTLHQTGFPVKYSFKKRAPNQLFTYLRLQDSTEHNRTTQQVLILLTQVLTGVVCVAAQHNSNKLTLPEVWGLFFICSSMLTCFPWGLFSGLQKIIVSCIQESLQHSELSAVTSQCSFNFYKFWLFSLKNNQVCYSNNKYLWLKRKCKLGIKLLY